MAVVDAADASVWAPVRNLALLEIDGASLGHDGKDSENHQCGKVLGKVHNLTRRRGTLSSAWCFVAVL